MVCKDCEALSITPMAADYTLYMQLTADDSEVKDSFSDFGFAVSEIPWPDEEAKAVATRDWPDEDGEDAYIPPTGLVLKAYDLTVEFVYKGEAGTAYSAYKALRGYLISGELKIYDPYWKRGCKGVWVKKLGNLEPFRTNADEGVSAKVTFRVGDPKTEVLPGPDEDGTIIGLGAV